MPDDLRTELEAAAQRRRHTLTDELMARLRLSLAREREQERDPAIRALNFVIAQLAERVSGGTYMVDKEARSGFLKEWRTDPFKFRAFKFAVGRLLDELQPPGEISPLPEAAIKDAAKHFGVTPEFERVVVETYKTPEAYGAFEFGALWAQLKRAAPITEQEKELLRRYPTFGEFIEREFYGFEKARHDLELMKQGGESERPRTRTR
jgi:hypothetical protein